MTRFSSLIGSINLHPPYFSEFQKAVLRLLVSTKKDLKRGLDDILRLTQPESSFEVKPADNMEELLQIEEALKNRSQKENFVSLPNFYINTIMFI